MLIPSIGFPHIRAFESIYPDLLHFLVTAALIFCCRATIQSESFLYLSLIFVLPAGSAVYSLRLAMVCFRRVADAFLCPIPANACGRGEFSERRSKRIPRFAGTAQKTGNPDRNNLVTLRPVMDIIKGI